MRAILCVVAIFAISFGPTTADYTQQTFFQDSLRSRRSYDRWLDIISQYARGGAADGPNSYQPFPVDLPVTGKDGKHTTLPLLVLPFPVPVPAPAFKQECNANNDRDGSNRQKDNSYGYTDKYREDRYKEDRNRDDRYKESRYRDDKYKEDRYKEERNREDRYKEERNREDRYKEDKYKEDNYRKDKYEEENNRYKENNNRYHNRNYDVRFGVSEFPKNDDKYEPKQSESVSSDYLIEIFKKQRPMAPELPPALIHYAPEITSPSISLISRGSSVPQESSVPRGFSSERQYLPPATDAAPPSPPRFDRSMVVRGYLTVPKADYTEAYTAWYDARSGSSRVEYHDGGTTCYRSMTSDSRVKRMVTSMDRTGEKDVVVCGETASTRASSADREPPVFPNTEGFSYAGTKEEFGVSAEVWKQEVRGREGEKGGARGEALLHRHELLVHRRSDGFNVPLKYKVEVDSSVLGANCDGYEHVYSEVREKEHDEDKFSFNTDRQCDVVDKLDPNEPEHMARLDPIREFTLPSRDPRHDAGFDSFVKEFERTYVDNKETAMRKNLLVQSTRFITSCNRQSETFSLAVNFLSDRLLQEVEVILGVEFSSEAENNTALFPYRQNRVDDLQQKLPKEFDWRPRGGVTPVKYQGTCASCWAFAVTGSVEGALFIKTKQLVELSVQSLVDCAKSHGAHGCKGTWPVHAYNYIKDRGIPADAEYTAYDAKEHSCKAPPTLPVTHIQGGVDVPPNNIDALKLAIRRYAPTVVVVDAKAQTFIHYNKGVLRDDRCVKGPKKKLNHAVLAVGWGERRGAPHFIIKNSWSAKWGEGGFIRLHAPSNTCGHLTTPSFALLRRRDVDRLPGGAPAQGRDARGEDDDDYEDRR